MFILSWTSSTLVPIAIPLSLLVLAWCVVIDVANIADPLSWVSMGLKVVALASVAAAHTPLQALLLSTAVAASIGFVTIDAMLLLADLKLGRGAVGPLALSAAIVMGSIAVVAALFVWPVFVGIYAETSAAIPLTTAATVAQPFWKQLVAVVLLGPCLFTLVRLRCRCGDSPWLFMPGVLLTVWLTTLTFAAYRPL